MITTREIQRADEERETSLRCAIFEALKHGGEKYSVELWRAWARDGGDREMRSAVPYVRRMLRTLEAEGEIVGRDVRPEEHGGSLLRRYYRRAWRDE